MSRKVFVLGIAAVAMFIFAGCSSDDSNDGYNNQPTTGTLRGNVIFHGEWPDSGAVQLSIFENWDTDPCSWCGVAPGGPPSYYTPASYFQDPDPNNGSGPDTVAFEITGISLGNYASVAVGWRAPYVSDINCDEPTIGLYGAEWGTTDSIPEVLTFTSSQNVFTVNVNAYFDILPVPGCNDRGRIEGAARVAGTWPPEGLLVMLTTFPVSGWNPVMGQPTAYHIMPTPADTVFRFTPPFGTYHLSIWTNAQPPAPSQWFGSYGIDTFVRPGHPVVSDARPNAVTLSEQTPAAANVIIPGNAPAPHWISGNITFNGTRPAEGLLVMVTTQPVSPIAPPTQQPFGYFVIADPTETLYAISGMGEETFYLSLWNNVQGPGSVCYGAYGYAAGSDPDPDPVVISSDPWGVNNINLTGQP